MGTQTQRKREFQEVEGKQQEKLATHGQSVATEVRIALPPVVTPASILIPLTLS